jgi:hypothetical protein
MEEWPEVCQSEGLTKQQQDILTKLGNKPEKSKGKEAGGPSYQPKAAASEPSK